MDFVGVEKLSLVDYDHHMSAVLFSPGCNFACPFCHNSALVIAPEFNNPIPFEEILSFLKKRQGLLDYIAMDVKASFDTYPSITNSRVNIDKIKESIEYIKSCGVDYEFRTTLVREYHDIEDIKKMSEDIGPAKRMRLQLFVDNDNCIKTGLHEVPLEEAEEYIKILKSHIDDVALRGYII